jgi:hypothetical protein
VHAVAAEDLGGRPDAGAVDDDAQFAQLGGGI